MKSCKIFLATFFISKKNEKKAILYKIKQKKIRFKNV